MEGDLLYPAKSHRKIINVPKESVKLAELLGIIFGDGGINGSWQVIVSLSSLKDTKYSIFVASLFLDLFGIKTTVKKRVGENCIRVICSSVNVVDFLVSKGALRGNKILQNIAAPAWILNNPTYQKAFVRGLVDTDGCLYTHRHFVGKKMQYNIGFCFTSFSKKLLFDVAGMLKNFGVEPHIPKSEKNVCLYSVKAVRNYLEIFGSSNERISNVYKNWLKEKTGEIA